MDATNAAPRGAMEVSLGMSPNAAGVGANLPELDDHLVELGTPFEMLDGKLVPVSADKPHAERHAQVCTLVSAHVIPGLKVACDLLTRTSQVDDIAPDISVSPESDPVTGRRPLQVLAVEVVSTQTLGNAANKASKLVERGVRRVLAIEVERSRAMEWSIELGTWKLLDPAGTITDPVLAVPLPIKDLIHSVTTDDAIARALVGKHNPVIEAVRAEGRVEGIAEGRAEGAWAMADGILGVLEARGVAVSSAAREQLLAERDLAQLRRWIVRAATCASADELLAERQGAADGSARA